MEGALTSWDAPGPGRWNLERSHFGGEFTVAYRDVYQRGQHDGLQATMARYGVAVSHLAIAYVNDRPYMRVVPLFETPARLASRQPPKAMVWLLSRLHPAFRRRNRAARRMLARRLWREEGDRWYREQKPAAIAANLALQDEAIESSDDDALADHLDRTIDNVYEGVRLHFELVGPDAFSVGDFLVACERWGISTAEGLALMAGSSPASADTARLLASGDTTEYLRHYGWRAVANYDVDSPTVGEMPSVVAAAVKAVAENPLADAAPPIADVRARVPADERAAFDELLEEARYAYGIRDDNAGITLQWTVGLVRRALLEAGRRLLARGAVEAVEDLFELTPAETGGLLRGATAPARAEITRRREERAANNALDAPRTLGPEDVLPPLEALPGPLRRVGAAFIVQADLLYSDETLAPLSGAGIGDAIARGPARVVRSAEDAFDRLQPGDVLVTTMTTPAYDAVLPIVAGLVVEEGGMLSHAAIVAREFGLPAVIGARGALAHIADGQTIEVDPTAGTVRVVD
jgi:pyruvate,water dikinase